MLSNCLECKQSKLDEEKNTTIKLFVCASDESKHKGDVVGATSKDGIDGAQLLVDCSGFIQEAF